MNYPNHPSNASTSRWPKVACRAGLLLVLGAGAIFMAMSLRYCPSSFRQIVTDMLGAEGRAVLEHALAALGLPLVLHMILVMPQLLWLQWGDSLSAWLWLAAKRNLASLVNISSATELFRQSGKLRMKIAVAAVWVTQNTGRIISVVYFLGTSLFEFSQAYISVYGDGPRGYLQYGQMLADATGAFLAMYAAQRTIRNTELI